jgi:hypothetical protein
MSEVRLGRGRGHLPSDVNPWLLSLHLSGRDPTRLEDPRRDANTQRCPVVSLISSPTLFSARRYLLSEPSCCCSLS